MHETNDSRRPEVGNLQLSQPGDYTHLLPELSQCYTLRTHMKQALASVLKAVAGIAGLVFLLAPVTGMGILVSVIGLMHLLALSIYRACELSLVVGALVFIRNAAFRRDREYEARFPWWLRLSLYLVVLLQFG